MYIALLLLAAAERHRVLMHPAQKVGDATDWDAVFSRVCPEVQVSPVLNVASGMLMLTAGGHTAHSMSGVGGRHWWRKGSL